jgi:hypothetical protein
VQKGGPVVTEQTKAVLATTGLQSAEEIIPAQSRERTATFAVRNDGQISALIPKDDRPAESPARGRRPIRRLNGAECNTWSESGVGQHRHAHPGGASDDDGTHHGERLAPPFRGNADVYKGEASIIAGARAAGTVNSSPTTRRTMGERATEKANCPATSVILPETKPMTVAPSGPAPVLKI